MKYCIHCGTKLEENTNFCIGCGAPTENGIEIIKEKKRVRDEEKTKQILLRTGVALIVLASLIFTIFTFKNISDLFKSIVLGAEALTFMYAAAILKKKELKYGYRALWLIGVMLIPIALCILTSHELLGSISFFMDTALLYVYLALVFFISSLIYLLSYKFINSRFYLYLSYLCFNTIICILTLMTYNCFDIKFSINVFSLEMIVLFTINYIVQIVALIVPDNNVSKTLRLYLKIFFTMSVVLTMVLIYSKDSIIIEVLATVINIVSIYTFAYTKKESIYNVFIPLFVTPVVGSLISIVLKEYNTTAIVTSLLIVILLFFINHLVDNEGLKVSNYIYSYLVMFILLISSFFFGFDVSAICFSIAALFAVINIFAEPNKVLKEVVSYALLIEIFCIIYSLISYFKLTEGVYALLLASVLYSFIYVILKTAKKNGALKFEIASYSFIILACIFSGDNLVLNIINECVLVYYFILKLFFDDHSAIRTSIMVVSLINLLIILLRLDVNIYYLYVSYSALLLVIALLGEISKKYKGFGYYIASLVFILFALFVDFAGYSLFAVISNLLVYIILYFIFIKKQKEITPIRLIYLLLGFILMYKLFYTYISVVQIASILAFVFAVISLIILYLTESESDRSISLLSLITLYPYVVLVNSIEIISELSFELSILPFIVYTILFFEKIFYIKNESLKYTFELLILGILNFIIYTNMAGDTSIATFGILLELFYVIKGLVKKELPFVTFGCVTLVISAVLLFLEGANSLVLVFTLLFVGICLITFISIKESKSKKQEKIKENEKTLDQEKIVEENKITEPVTNYETNTTISENNVIEQDQSVNQEKQVEVIETNITEKENIFLEQENNIDESIRKEQE